MYLEQRLLGDYLLSGVYCGLAWYVLQVVLGVHLCPPWSGLMALSPHLHIASCQSVCERVGESEQASVGVCVCERQR